MPSRETKTEIRRVLAAIPPNQRAAQLADARACISHWRDPRGPVAAAIWRGWVLKAAMLRAQARVPDLATTGEQSKPAQAPPQQPGGYTIIQARRKERRATRR